MPFTFAHPLYAAPLKAVKPGLFSLTGLILGSMSPDFEYFIALEPHETIGHSLEGLFLMAMPLSICFALLFHRVIKEPLAACLPSVLGLDARARSLVVQNPWSFNSLHRLLLFLLSVAIGFLSHVFVDSFTHRAGYFSARLGILQSELAGYPIYKLLQHGASLLGLTLQAIIVFILLKRVRIVGSTGATVKRSVKTGYWAIVAVSSVITVALKILLSDSTNLIGMAIVSALSGAMIGLVLASLLFRLRQG